MNKELIDASALINLISTEDYERIINGSILDLTYYEIGNIVWKWVKIRKTVKEEEAIDLFNNIIRLLEKASVYTVKEIEDKVLKVAIELDLTYYDSAYLVVAKENNLTLLTCDKKLYEAAKRLIKKKVKYLKPVV